MKAKGVFFDLYGTLLILGDIQKAWSDWMEVLYRSLCPDASLSKSGFDECCHQFFSSEPPPAANDGLTVFERRIRRLARSLDPAIDPPDLRGLAERATDAWQAQVRPDPTALGVLAAIKTHKTLALISNFDHPPHAYKVLRETGLDAHFETVVISGEVGVRKPDPAIFRIALEATGLPPGDVIYIGDTEEDVKGATAAGMQPILIARPHDSGRPRLLDYARQGQRTADGGRAIGAARTIGALSELTALFSHS